MSDYRAAALSLKMTLLKHLSQAWTPMMMSNIAALFELLFNQLFHVKQCLEDEGYLRQDDPRYYHLTHKRLCSRKPLFIVHLAKSDCCQRLMKDFIWRSGFSPTRGGPVTLTRHAFDCAADCLSAPPHRAWMFNLLTDLRQAHYFEYG